MKKATLFSMVNALLPAVFVLTAAALGEEPEKKPVLISVYQLHDWLAEDLGDDLAGIFRGGDCRAEAALVEKVIGDIQKEAAERLAAAGSDNSVKYGTEEDVGKLTEEARSLASAPGNDPRWRELYIKACQLRDAGPRVIPEPKKDPAPYADYQLRDWLAQDTGDDFADIFSGDDSRAEAALVGKVIGDIQKEAADRSEEDSVKDDVALLTAEAQSLASAAGNDPRWRELYIKACQVRRRGRLEIVVDTTPVLIYTKHGVLGGSHYAYTENVTDAQYLEDYMDNFRDSGAVLCKMTISADGTVRSEDLMKTDDGFIRDPDISYDGRKMVFSKRDSFLTDDYHLYDYDFQTGEVRQLTFGLGFADLEPVYLPDGNILFASTRCMQTTDCWWTDVANFFLCDSDGRYTRRISFDQVTVNSPRMTDDGRILYTRWDYNDRTQVFPQGLFAMNPDGTGQTAIYGNDSWFPTTILHARAIPGTSGHIVAISSGHHTKQHGKLIVIDRKNGTEEDQGCHYIAPVAEAVAERIDMNDQHGDQFQYPYPLDERNFLVSMLPEIRSKAKIFEHESFPGEYGIFWIDEDGRRESLCWDAELSCGQHVPLAARQKPVLRPSTVDFRSKTGQFYVQNVYEGPGLEGVQPGTIKTLRVIALEFRPAGVYENWNFGPGGYSQCTTPIGCDNASWDVKRIIGDVPVEEDGSAWFEVPARTPLYFQLLDAEGRAVQSMRSWSTLQPNEFFGCIGCHEPKDSTIDNVATLAQGNQTIALNKGVAIPKPLIQIAEGDDPNRGFSFPKDVQPILDRHCIECHKGFKPPKDAKDENGNPIKDGPFSLLPNPVRQIPTVHPTRHTKKPEDQRCGRVFSEAYLNLTEGGKFEKYIHPICVQDAPPMYPPYYAGSPASPLIDLLLHPDENHKDVKLSEEELRIIEAWIDLVVPYCGTYTESRDWAISKEAEFFYNLMKRKAYQAFEADNIRLMLDVQAGRKSPPPYGQIERMPDFGPEVRAKFINDYVEEYSK